MRKYTATILGVLCLFAAAYFAGSHHSNVVYAQSDYARSMTHGTVPKSYGHMVSAIADSIGTGLVFEDESGVIRFVSITGMKEGELARYDQTPTHGGIPKSYGHLVSAVVRNGSTALVFEDSQGVIRFVTITGSLEGELTRE
jgi:hypothetical protein